MYVYTLINEGMLIVCIDHIKNRSQPAEYQDSAVNVYMATNEWDSNVGNGLNFF